jgi:hypothetical protein
MILTDSTRLGWIILWMEELGQLVRRWSLTGSPRAAHAVWIVYYTFGSVPRRSVGSMHGEHVASVH